MANKVKFGLKNVHYAPLTEGAEGDTYETPIPIPGAVNMSLEPVGEDSEFVADDIEYYTSSGNNGYDGDLEIALVPESFEEDVLGEVEDAKMVAFETINAAQKPFALLFEINGDSKARRWALYKCFAKRPKLEASATVNKEVKTTALTLKARPNSAGHPLSHTKDTTDATVYNSWYTSVHAYTEV